MKELSKKITKKNVYPIPIRRFKNKDEGFFELAQGVNELGLEIPTFSEITSITYEYFKFFNSGEGNFNDGLISNFYNNNLCGNTRILHTEEGNYIEDSPNFSLNKKYHIGSWKLKENIIFLKDRLDLEEDGVIWSKDKSLRFVPNGFKKDRLKSSELSKHPLIIALEKGREGAEKLSYIASHSSYGDPYIDVVNHWPSGWTNGYYRELFATLGISYLPSLKIQEGIFSKPNLKIEGIKATDVKDVFTLGKYS